MPAPHPRELRQRVIDAYDEGEGTYIQLAERFRIGVASVSRWLSLHRRTGDVQARSTGGNRRAEVPEEVRRAVDQLVRDEPNWTTQELADQIEEDFGLALSRRQVGRLLGSLGFTFKRGSFDLELPPTLHRSQGGKPISENSPR